MVKMTKHVCRDCGRDNDLCITRYLNGRIKSIQCTSCWDAERGTMAHVPAGLLHPAARKKRNLEEVKSKPYFGFRHDKVE